MPDLTTLRDSPRKVFAHYVPGFPLMINLVPASVDYYSQGYLDPAGESGKWLYCGGFLRDRPLPTSLVGLDEANFLFQNDKSEIRTATSAGIDGFDYDLMSASVGALDEFRTMLDAAQEVSNFLRG